MISDPALKWAVAATAYFLVFFLYALTPAPIDAVVLALYVGLVAVSMLIPLGGGEGWASKAASVYLRLSVAQATLFSISVLLILSSYILHLRVEKYAGATLVIFSTIFLVGAPGRLARLGDYLRRYGPDGIVRRSPFGTRDDHFFLDYSIGRWFRHTSFALGYAGLLVVYFLGWFLTAGLFWLPLSVPLLPITFAISKRSARSLLSPYDPTSVATQIELVYPPRPLRNVSSKSLLVTTFFYLIAAWSAATSLSILLLFVIPYFIFITCLLVLRRWSHTSDGK
ncbi:MAG TPA: hypothetical protein VFE98_04120 [Candidatus Bathyarchaeia archaeon]|nr:hypothetical protein [Candidatus Bathyarchaeia archaeon]